MEMDKSQKIWLVAAIIILIAACALIYVDWTASPNAMGNFVDTGIEQDLEMIKYNKNMDVWFMLMMVAFLMIFIRKFEWGVALGVLLSTAGSFLGYLFIKTTFFDIAWSQDLMIGAVVCAITIVIGIGVFLGLVKMWQYLLVGVLFAPAYVLIEWFLANPFFGLEALDTGGSMLVHMVAAYFGIGVILALREKRSFDEPMYTTTHSITFVWLASMLLWMLWPSFVTGFLVPEETTQGLITCYMAGIGSIISAYFVCMIIQKKVNPLTYTYALLAGPVAIGGPLLILGPWGALVLGLVAGAVSALCFIYLQPWLSKKMGNVDMMGVHNLHGVAGWIGALSVCIITLTPDNAVFAIIVAALAVGTGAIAGIIIRFTRGDMPVLVDDETDFIKSEAPQ